ncbi:Hypp8637 [Branchiostoma lanceolatum]|uniref:Hypp8637 protein n=1 Tax=Branchiostoma lanceolatum TaxID=7740 RepID=A0A8J9Z9M4_BRALA|nr:Hypp8637 [Branchiostoma lanceolatum]
MYHTDLEISHNQSNIENNITSHTLSQNAATTDEHSGGISQTTSTMRTLGESVSRTVHENTTLPTGNAEDRTPSTTRYSIGTHPSTQAHTLTHPSPNTTLSNAQSSPSSTDPMFNIVASPSIIYIGDWDKLSNHTAPATIPDTNLTTASPSVAASHSQLIVQTAQHSTTLTTLIKGVTSHKTVTHRDGSSLPTLSTLSNTSPRTALEPLQRTTLREEHTDSTIHSIPNAGTRTTIEPWQRTSPGDSTTHGISSTGRGTLTTIDVLQKTSPWEEHTGITTKSTSLSVSTKEGIHSTTTSGEAPVTPSQFTSTKAMSLAPLTKTTTHQQPTSSYTLPISTQETTNHVSTAHKTHSTLSPSLTLSPSTSLPHSTPIQSTVAAPTTPQATTLAPSTMATTTAVPTTTTKATTAKATTAKVTTAKPATVKVTTARPKVTSNTTVVTVTTTPAPPYLVQAPPRTAYLVPDQIPADIMVSISSIIVFDKPWHRDLTRAWSREYKTFTGAFSTTMLTYFERVRNSGFDSLVVDQLNSMTVDTSAQGSRRKRQVEEYTAVAYTAQYAYNRLMASGGVDKVLRRTGIPAAIKDKSLNVDGFNPVGNTELTFTSQSVVNKEALEQLVQYDNPCQYYECDSGFSCHQEAETTKFSCISRCMVNYCLTKGFCTHLLEGHPTCKCDSNSGGWYTGERCEYFISHVAAICIAVGVQALLLACIIFKRRKDSPYLLPVRIAPAASYTRSVHALGKR